MYNLSSFFVISLLPCFFVLLSKAIKKHHQETYLKASQWCSMALYNIWLFKLIT